MSPLKKRFHSSRKLIASETFLEPTSLFEAIGKLLPEATRTSKKQYLRDRCVCLNGTPTTQYDTNVEKGDRVEIFSFGFALPFSHPKIKLLWQDDYFILLEKMPGIATVSNHPGLKETVFRIVANYIKEDDPSKKIFLLNRLDSETQGFILFCKNRALQQKILNEWGKYITRQEFSAVVEGLFETPSGELKGNLRKREHYPKSSKPTTRRSTVKYRVEAEGDWSSLVTLSLLGRFNGIRTLLKEDMHPVVGENTPLCVFQSEKNLLLRQTCMILNHPVTDKSHIFRLKTPPHYRSFLARPLTNGEEARVYAQQKSDNEK